MPDCMIDIETLGNRPGCIVLSIGAVEFDMGAGTLGKEFHIVINRQSCEKKGLHQDQDTLDWWSRQSAEARKLLAEAETSKNGLGGALVQFSGFLQQFGKRDLRPWGCGSDFDISILSHCYHVVGMPLPWMFWNSRCLRTLRHLSSAKAPPRDGVYHSALDDARNQANEAIHLYRMMRSKVAVSS